MYYQKIKAALRTKPEPTMIIGYYQPTAFSADELAELAGCAPSSIRKYVSRLRKEGYDVRQNEDKEYYIEVEPEYRPEFGIAIRRMRTASSEKPHEILITHNGAQWSGMHVNSLRELRELHEALGEYIQEVIDETAGK